MIDDLDHLRSIEAEDGFVAGAFLPVAGSAGREPHAHAEVWQHADLARAFENKLQLAGHLEHEHDLEAHLLRVQREVDELLVLIAIANDECLGVIHVGKRGDQLRLGSGL